MLIQCLVSINKKVLLAAFTHSAVDNILAKLTKEVSPERILRLGSSSTIKDSIQKMTLKGKLQNESSEDYYRSVKLILKTTVRFSRLTSLIMFSSRSLLALVTTSLANFFSLIDTSILWLSMRHPWFSNRCFFLFWQPAQGSFWSEIVNSWLLS